MRQTTPNGGHQSNNRHTTAHETQGHPRQRDEHAAQIEDRIWRISLPLPFALRQVNVYLIGDEAGHWTLVDAGLGLGGDEAALRAGLATAGVEASGLSAIVLTHAHPDHIGLARALREASGAPIIMLEREDERMYSVWGEPNGPALVAVTRFFVENGMRLSESQSDPRVSSAARVDEADGLAKGSREEPIRFALPPREAIRTVVDGETLTLGRWRYDVIWTPGHSDYHMCLLREDGILISGDHILPSITPNIGLYPESRPSPLRDYFESLQRVRNLPARLTLPGHRQPFTALTERVDELTRHHIERANDIVALVAAHPDGVTAATVADGLFGMRLRTIDDRRFAMAETLAHLEELRHQERVTRERRDSLYVYRLAR